MTIGQRIKSKREELGIKQTDLAAILKISKQTLYKYENDIVTNIPSNIIEGIASILDCTPQYIMGWDEVMTFDSPEAFEKHWNAIGGGRHPITLNDTEYTMVVNYRAADPGIQESVLKLLDVKSEKNVSLNA